MQHRPWSTLACCRSPWHSEVESKFSASADPQALSTTTINETTYHPLCSHFLLIQRLLPTYAALYVCMARSHDSTYVVLFTHDICTCSAQRMRTGAEGR